MEADAANLDDHEQAGEILAGEVGQGAEQLAVRGASRELVGKTKHDDARMGAGREVEDVGEAHVRGDEDPAVRLGVVEDPSIGLPTEPDVTDVIGSEAGLTERQRGGSRRVLVDEEGGHSGDTADLLGGDEAGGVAEGGANVVGRDGVLVGDGLDGHAAGEPAEEDRDGDAGPLDDGFAEADGGIADDAWGEPDDHGDASRVDVARANRRGRAMIHGKGWSSPPAPLPQVERGEK